MTPCLRRLCLAGVFTVTVASAAQAEPIRIIGGSLIWNAGSDGIEGSSSAVRLQGQEGFTFEGTTGNGVFGPSDCNSSVCGAGSVISLLARWSGADLEGDATLRGQSYNLGSTDALASMEAEWTGQMTLPSGFTGGSVSAPFLFTGEFQFASGPNEGMNRVQLRGGGVATLGFSPFPGEPGAFLVNSARYDFSAAPTPEPATFVLVGLGAVAMAKARSRQRREERLSRI